MNYPLLIILLSVIAISLILVFVKVYKDEKAKGCHVADRKTIEANAKRVLQSAPPKPKTIKSDPNWEEFTRLFAESLILQENKKREEEDRQCLIEKVINRDKRDFSSCCKAANKSILLIIKTLNGMHGGDKLLCKMKKNDTLLLKEFIILCAVYNNLFLDYLVGNERLSGAFRLCKLLKLASACGPSLAQVEDSEIGQVDEKMRFYRDEIEFLNTSKYGLPINLLYPLFNPCEGISDAKQVTEIDPFACMYIWQIIKESLKIEDCKA